MIKKTLLMLITVALVASESFGYDFQVNNIFYTKTSSNTVKVVQKSGDYTASYTGVVNIPETVAYQGVTYNVTALGNKAFHWCRDVTTVKIPNTVTSIGEKCFYGCFSLSNITLPNKLDSISDYTFQDCSSLKAITLPSTIKGIGPGAFDGCQSLKSISLSNSIKRIGHDAFSGCSELAAVNLPSSLKTIEYRTFSGCTGLTSFIIPNIVETIQSEAFSSCKGLKSITIPNSVVRISSDSFRGCQFSSLNVDNNNSVYDSRNNCNAIIETKTNTLITGCSTTIIPSSIKRIGEHAFNSCKIESLTIPNGVETIWLSAFNNSSLKKLIIPASVDTLRGYRDNIPLESISVSSENKRFDSRVNCNAIIESETNTLLMGCKNSSIPESVDTIGTYAFAYCYNLPSVEFPASLKCIKKNAFTFCYGLKTIDLPNGLERIEEGAFSLCHHLSSVRIPGTVKSIGLNAFMACDDLTSLTIDEGVEQIGGYAFSGCGLTNINLPQSVKSLGDGVFNDTPFFDNNWDHATKKSFRFTSQASHHSPFTSGRPPMLINKDRIAASADADRT